jgi:heme/copper-type cytochrome/quinol oxidase subunit 2
MKEIHRRRTARTVAAAAVILPALLAMLAAFGRVDVVPPAIPGTAVMAAQDANRAPQEVRIVARKYSFAPQRIEVQENDLVKVTMEAADIPHSFVIDDDHYRIAKRATPGHAAVFEFRADKAGTFPFYCNLTADSGCRNMRGELVVKARRQP